MKLVLILTQKFIGNSMDINFKMKFKFTTVKIFKLIFAGFFVINLVIAFFVYNFIRNQVYGTMFISREELLQNSNLKVEDIDLERFNTVIKSIDEKQNVDDIKEVNNIFK